MVLDSRGVQSQWWIVGAGSNGVKSRWIVKSHSSGGSLQGKHGGRGWGGGGGGGGE